jgi:hypothetical protein
LCGLKEIIYARHLSHAWITVHILRKREEQRKVVLQIFILLELRDSLVSSPFPFAKRMLQR